MGYEFRNKVCPISCLVFGILLLVLCFFNLADKEYRASDKILIPIICIGFICIIFFFIECLCPICNSSYSYRNRYTNIEESDKIIAPV
jgi:hypothetical protein